MLSEFQHALWRKHREGDGEGGGVESEWGCLEPGLGPEVRDGLGEGDSW